MKLKHVSTTLVLTVLLIGGVVAANVVAFAEPTGSPARPQDTWGTPVIVDSQGTNLYSSLALDSLGRPRIGYIKQIGNSSYVKLAEWRSGQWITTNTAITGTTANLLAYPSLSLDRTNGDAPAISFRSQAGLEYTSRDAQGKWTNIPVDSQNIGSVQHISFRLDKYGRPHISYYVGLTGELRYAHMVGTNWDVQKVDWGTSVLGVGEYSSLDLEDTGTAIVPHIAYKSNPDNTVRHAWLSGAAFVTETIASVGGPQGGHVTFRLDPHDSYRPHVAYYFNDGTTISLRYTYKNGAWAPPENVLTQGADAGRYASLALDSAGNPHLTFTKVVNNRNQLLYARRQGGAWLAPSTVDDGGGGTYSVGSYSSLALDSADRAMVAYTDKTRNYLKFAAIGELIDVTPDPATAEPTRTNTPRPGGTTTPTATGTRTVTPGPSPTKSGSATRTATPTPRGTPGLDKPHVFMPLITRN